MNKNKIIYICEAMGGGVRRHILDLIYHLDLSKYEIYLIYSKKRADKIFLNELKNLNGYVKEIFEVNQMVRNISPINDLLSLVKIVKIINEIKPQIIHCHSSKAGALGRIAARICGITNVFYTPHAYIMQKPDITMFKRNLFTFTERLLDKFTNMTINVSNGEREFAIKNSIISDVSKSVVIYNGIESPNIKKKKFDKNQIIIGTAARLDDQKDPFTFYKIAKIITSRHKNVKFVYIGDGPLKRSIHELIIKDNLDDKINLMGFKNDVMKSISQFDLFLTTSLYEGLPYSLIEAISVGLPIVGTNVIGNSEIIKHKYNGLLFEPGDEVAGALMIEHLLLNNHLLDHYANKSKEFFKRNFIISNMIRTIDKLYTNELYTHHLYTSINNYRNI